MKNRKPFNEKNDSKEKLNREKALEQDMRYKIIKSAENIQIPDPLKPESIKASLDNSLNAAEKQTAGPGNLSRRKNRSRIYRNLAAAACLCLCFGGSALFYSYYNNHIKSNADNQELQFSQTEAKDDKHTGSQAEAENDGNANGQKTQSSNDTAAVNEEKTVKKIGKFYTLASNYRQVYRVLKKSQNHSLTSGSSRTESFAVDDVAVKKSESTQNPKEMAVSGDFSTTNLQVTGVDESDAVKTDGKFIYVVQEEQIQILDAQKKTLKLAATLKPDIEESLDSICEIYVADNVLTVILQADQTDIQGEVNIPGEQTDRKNDETQDIANAMKDVLYIDYDPVTKVLTYDITDPVHPALLDTMEQDGFYQTSRKMENHLYLFTNKSMYPDSNVTQKEFSKDSRTGKLIPCINGEAISPDCIYLPKEEGNQGIVMACIDLAAHCNVTDTKLLVNQGGQLYVTTDSVYFYYSEYVNDTEKTRLVRFALDGSGNIYAKAAASLKGSITDTFAIYENDGYLRVLTSLTWEDPWENRVYVIRTEDMEITGKLTGIAMGEMIYAARFIGTTGYFVTYRNTDPLFTVDFSNPENPKLIGELSVTGFSEYLHFWSDDKLLGIGYETNPTTGETIGVKLSMYDISNPKKVTEQTKTVLQGTDDSEAMYDYKSVLVDRSKNLIAFTTHTYAEQYHADYHVFSLKNGEFINRLERSIGEDGCGERLRSLYIGDMLYLAGSRKALAFYMPDGFKETGKITY